MNEITSITLMLYNVLIHWYTYLWGLFTPNIFPGKSNEKLNPQEKPSYLKIKFLSLWILIITDFSMTEDWFLLLSKIEIRKLLTMIKTITSRVVNGPLRPTQKSHDSDGFSHFLEKLETFLRRIIRYITEDDC